MKRSSLPAKRQYGPSSAKSSVLSRPAARALGWLLWVAAAVVLGGGVGVAYAEGVTCVAPAPNPPTDGSLMLATREYRWTFYAPVMSVHKQAFVAKVLTPKTNPRRYDYEVPALHTERRVLWKYPEFSCRYPIGALPNECETVWRNAYAELPVLAAERDHIIVDIPAWTWTDATFYVEVPSWTYVEKPLTISVPVVVSRESCAIFVGDAARAVPKEGGGDIQGGYQPASSGVSIESTQAGLEAQLAAVLSALDQGIANIDATIASIKASGGDPGKVLSSDGKSTDMFAIRASLVEQKIKMREHFAPLIGDVDAVGKTSAP